MAPQTDSSQLDIHPILQRLPHRFPFLLVDRVLDDEVAHARLMVAPEIGK